MDRTEIEARVRAVVARELGFKEDQIKRTDTFIEDLGADSLEVVELVLSLEEEFAMEISDEAWSPDGNIKTVQNVIDYISAELLGDPLA